MTPGHVTRWRWLLALTALLFAPLSIHAQSAVLSRAELQQQLEDSRKALRDIVTASRKFPASTANLRDTRGRSLKEDVRQNVMLPEIRQRLEALLASAKVDLAAGDLPGAQINIVTARQMLAAEIERYSAIFDYWKNVGWKSRAEGVAGNSELGDAGDTPVAGQIATLSAQFDRQLAARDFVTAMRTTWVEIDALEARVRKDEEQRVLASVDASHLQPLRSIGPGRKPCPPATRTSGSEQPGFRTAEFPKIIDYYPPGRSAGPANQTVELFVVVSATGCAERSFLIKGAERPEFDDGALRMAADGRFFPAEKDGVPVRGGLVFRLKF